MDRKKKKIGILFDFGLPMSKHFSVLLTLTFEGTNAYVAYEEKFSRNLVYWRRFITGCSLVRILLALPHMTTIRYGLHCLSKCE